MALAINFDICIDSSCSTFTLTELTGLYSATNTGGWGTPNPATGTITSAVIQVTSPSGSITTINLITNGFPSSNTSFSYDITNSALGTTSTLEDGAWKFFLFYSDGSNDYQKVHNYLFYCNTACCVNKMLNNIEIEECDCCNNSKSIKDYLKAKVFLDVLKNAAKCFQVDNFTSIKKILDKICVNVGCKTCK